MSQDSAHTPAASPAATPSLGDGAEQTELSAVPEDQLRAAVEAILIVADEPVSEETLAAALGVSEAEAAAIVEDLARDYDQAERGFIVRRAAGGWRYASAPRFSEVVERFVIGGATARLSQAALETLAVIAYRQPVTRGRVAAVRGVNVDGVVRTLHARGLIEEAGQEPSGALLYKTTKEFLEFVGLDSIEDLPPLAPYLPDASELPEIEDEAAERNL